MVATGVSLDLLREGLDSARQDHTANGVVWSFAEWSRVWLVLSPIQQHVILLHIVQGHNHTATAEQLGISRGSVDAAYRRAIARIRKAL